MKNNEAGERLCRNKNCKKVLPKDYKYRYCEACKIQHAENAKKALQGVGGAVVAVAGIAVGLLTKGKIELKK